MENVQGWVTLVASLLALGAVIWKFPWRKGWNDKEKQDMQDAIKKIGEDLDKLTKKVGEVDACAQKATIMIEPWWDVIKKNLPQLLNVSKSENLVTKLAENRISDAELEHLEQEVKILLVQDKNSGKVFVDLLALWAIQVRKIERSSKKVCQE